MEIYTMAITAFTAIVFASVAFYLHRLRTRSENAAPELLLSPFTRHRPRKKK